VAISLLDVVRKSLGDDARAADDECRIGGNVALDLRQEVLQMLYTTVLAGGRRRTSARSTAAGVAHTSGRPMVDGHA
jgi:hypothetical protein